MSETKKAIKQASTRAGNDHTANFEAMVEERKAILLRLVNERAAHV